MSEHIFLLNSDRISKYFIPEEYLDNNDPYFYRNITRDLTKYRLLNAKEIEILVKNNNFSEDWNEIYVTDNFNPNYVINCELYGRIYIGNMNAKYIEQHDIRLPIGLRNSLIISCEIGDDVSIRDVHYLAHYKIGDRSIIFNIDEMHCTNHSKFGNCIIKEGESEDVRIWIEIANENGGRKILGFENIITADAYIWSKYRDDKELMNKLKEITDNSFCKKLGYYGTIGNNSVIKNCRIIKDVNVGPYAYIKGANKIKNVTILSSKEEKSQIGEGVELVNGIVGYGSKIFYEAKGVRFVTGRNTQLKYGARLINSILGDNSTVSCCEILNNLIFPFHEQHHNNSFLIASTVMGQSNIAAGATIGSNHNSRAPDGEIIAGRGFWPGLCTNFKHNSKFSSFILIAKGSYNYEMNIIYPFSLVSLDKNDERIRITPCYWFIYNMYALERNMWKFIKRDLRVNKIQNIELDYLAPDTISEILFAIQRIEYLTGKNNTKDNSLKELDYIKTGRKLLIENNVKEEPLFDNEVMKKYGGFVEKPVRAWNYYRKFALYFSIKKIVDYLNIEKEISINSFIDLINLTYKNIKNYEQWINIGGQIIPAEELENIKNDIKNNKLKNWDQIHNRYNEQWEKYNGFCARYGLYVIEKIKDKKIFEINKDQWKEILDNVIDTLNFIYEATILSRKKDFDDPFRKITYNNENEMIEVLGKIEDNPFINDLKIKIDNYIKKIKFISHT